MNDKHIGFPVVRFWSFFIFLIYFLLVVQKMKKSTWFQHTTLTCVIPTLHILEDKQCINVQKVLEPRCQPYSQHTQDLQ